MLAYHSPTEPLQLGLPESYVFHPYHSMTPVPHDISPSIGLPEAGWFLSNVSKIYSPELTVGLTRVRTDAEVLHFGVETFDHVSYYRRAVAIISHLSRKDTRLLKCSSVLDESLILCTTTQVSTSHSIFGGDSPNSLWDDKVTWAIAKVTIYTKSDLLPKSRWVFCAMFEV